MSFFDKLKGTVEKAEKVEEEITKKKKGRGRPKMKRPEVEKTEIQPEIEEQEEPKKSAVPTQEESKKPSAISREKLQTGGQLTLDVYETENDFIIQSTVAGVKPEDLDISIEGDLVSVRGTRQKSAEEREEGKYLYQECYWGEFSREVILPEEVDAQKADAKIKDGVLTLRIPKARKTRRKKIAVTSSE